MSHDLMTDCEHKRQYKVGEAREWRWKVVPVSEVVDTQSPNIRCAHCNGAVRVSQATSCPWAAGPCRAPITPRLGGLSRWTLFSGQPSDVFPAGDLTPHRFNVALRTKRPDSHGGRPRRHACRLEVCRCDCFHACIQLPQPESRPRRSARLTFWWDPSSRAVTLGVVNRRPSR